MRRWLVMATVDAPGINRRVLLERRAQMDGAVAKIVRRDQPVATELALIAQVPVLGVHVMQPERLIHVKTRDRKSGILGRRIRGRKRVVARMGLIWIRESAGGAGQRDRAAPRRRQAPIAVRVGLRRVEEDSERGANA